jgi:hypothetical protein
MIALLLPKWHSRVYRYRPYTGTAADAGDSITVQLNVSGAQGDFDNVRLTDNLNSLPEPGFGAILGSGFAAETWLPWPQGCHTRSPDRVSEAPVAFIGDGGFFMLMAEFATAVKYKLPIKVLLPKNNTLGQIKWEQMVFLGNPEHGCELQPIEFAAFARACGGQGFTIDDPAACGEVLDEALAARAGADRSGGRSA